MSCLPGVLRNGYNIFLGEFNEALLKVEDGIKVSSIFEMRTLWCVNYMSIKLLKIIKDPQRTL